MKELIVVGKMNHTMDNSFESRNRVYDRGGCTPTLVADGCGKNGGKFLRRLNASRNQTGNKEGIY